jgi:hypothetical protein
VATVALAEVDEEVDFLVNITSPRGAALYVETTVIPVISNMDNCWHKSE